MPRAGLSPQVVVDAAAELADRLGADAVTLAQVADHLGVRTPSLYNHVDGLAGLQRLLTLKALGELEAVVHDAVGDTRGPEAVAALAHAYRAWAKSRPGLYSYVIPTTEGGDPEVAPTGARVLELVVDIVASLGPEGEDAVHATRVLRAAIHGFISLELAGGFGLDLDLDESYRVLVGAVIRGITAGR